jgi:hypothetical protein
MKIFWLLLPVSLLLFPMNGFGDPIAHITQPVATDFGTYYPYLVNITPNAPPYTVNPDFSNVSNFSNFTFTEEQKQKLRENGFVAVHGDYLEMYDIYNDCELNMIPAFVTIDSMLHIFHKQFDHILKTLEKERFLGDITNLSDALLEASFEDYNTSGGLLANEAARNNAAYFGVVKKLLDDTYLPTSPIATLVNGEIDLINAHSGFSPSLILLENHDYSQFIVRGHYEGDEDLEKYFKAMMWYGNMRFSFVGFFPPEELKRLTLQTLLATRLIYKNYVGTEVAYDVWKRVYVPTVFFVGESENMDFEEIDEIARSIYGEDYINLSPQDLSEETKLNSFMDAIKLEADAFRFMGQRYIPDTYILNTVSQDITMPKGLDVMVVLGSQRAEEILNEVYHDVSPYLAGLKAEFASYPDDKWAQNVYWNWLYCLMPVLDIKQEGYPPFMQSLAWREKDLAAALGSWAELRHDTILYTQQGATGELGFDKMDQGYVEANPEAFARLAAIVNYTWEGLENLDLMMYEFDMDLFFLKNTLLDLKTIAEKELTNQPLTQNEYSLIRGFGSTIENLMPPLEDPFGDEKEDMAIIADVHTHFVNCLEEAVGRPLVLYVIVDVAGDLRVACGAAFSYYEFEQPITNRLTDTAWRAMLDTGTAPDMPVWMNSYFEDQNPPEMNPEHSQSKENYVPEQLEILVSPNPISPDGIIQIKVRPDVHVTPYDTVKVEITTPLGWKIEMILNPDPEHPGEYIGSVLPGTCGHGVFYFNAQLLKDGSVVLNYRTFVLTTEPNSARENPWMHYE